MQRSSPLASLHLRLRLTSLCKRRFGGNRNEGIEQRIQCLYSAETRPSDFNRRDLLLLHQRRYFMKRETGDVVANGCG